MNNLMRFLLFPVIIVMFMIFVAVAGIMFVIFAIIDFLMGSEIGTSQKILFNIFNDK